LSKLFKLKRWLSVVDAAEHLARAFGEKVTESDVLRFALDGELTLSVFLVNGAFVSPCLKVNIEEIEWDEVPSLDGKATLKILRGGRVWQDEMGTFQVQEKIIELDADVFTLPMTGGERVDVEYRYQLLTGGPERTAVTLDGVLVASDDGQMFQIQTRRACKEPDSWLTLFHPDGFHPAGALPEDGVLVVRTDALTKFIHSLSGQSKADEKPLGTIERRTLLTIIAVLCKEAKIDYAQPAKAAGMILSTATKMGLSIGESTIESHLKKIPDALETRMK